MKHSMEIFEHLFEAILNVKRFYFTFLNNLILN